MSPLPKEYPLLSPLQASPHQVDQQLLQYSQNLDSP